MRAAMAGRATWVVHTQGFDAKIMEGICALSTDSLNTWGPFHEDPESIATYVTQAYADTTLNETTANGQHYPVTCCQAEPMTATAHQ